MKHIAYKNLYKSSKALYGELHPKTIWYKLCKSPILAPLTLLGVFYKIIMHGYKSLQRAIIVYSIERKFNEFVKINSDKKVSDFIKPIALYLPQFHTIPENDEWWGKGFTEWTNVKKATPLYKGHYQPHIPHEDIGYYDLSDVNVMRKQVKMAKEYGVYGFCFYYYHFANGKRLLEKPVNNYLQAKDIDFPFCFAWANENWTRNWDGGNKEVIMPQDYSEENILHLLKDMIPAFKDERYIKIDKKPVLLVYRAEIIPEIKTIVDKWREIIKHNGFEGIYLISMQNFEENNPYTMGFDAAVEFAPRVSKNIITKQKMISREEAIETNASFITMDQILKKLTYRPKSSFPRIKCVCPSWDNTPRRGKTGSRIILDSSVSKFAEFYKRAIKETIANDFPADGLLFINAWNEWGEGTHLEPDKKHGYQLLETIKGIMEKTITRLKNDKL